MSFRSKWSDLWTSVQDLSRRKRHVQEISHQMSSSELHLSTIFRIFREKEWDWADAGRGLFENTSGKTFLSCNLFMLIKCKICIKLQGKLLQTTPTVSWTRPQYLPSEEVVIDPSLDTSWTKGRRIVQVIIYILKLLREKNPTIWHLLFITLQLTHMLRRLRWKSHLYTFTVTTVCDSCGVQGVFVIISAVFNSAWP